MAETVVEDRWEFYPCRVDDAPASILLNMGFRPLAPIAEADTLYWCSIEMKDEGDHGMGSKVEAEQLWAPEDEITGEPDLAALRYVGRLRNRGRWQLTFYGPSDLLGALEATAARTLQKRGRTFEVGSKPDPRWSYYFDFLWPDDERCLWIKDRDVVAALVESGDSVERPRQVDHWIYFARAQDSAAFLTEAEALGFRVEQAHDDGAQPHVFGVQISRTDPVLLDHVHDVVMTLVDLAARYSGHYDGWEAPVVQ